MAKNVIKKTNISGKSNNTKVKSLIENAMKTKFSNQIDFANYLGVTQATVSRYLSGNNTPSLPVLQKIASILQIDLKDISQEYGAKEKDLNKNAVLPLYKSEQDAGSGIYTHQHILHSQQTLTLDAEWFKNEFNLSFIDNDIFAFIAQTDTMKPTINPKDTVIAKKVNQNNYNGYCLVNYNNYYLICKLQFKNTYLVKLIFSNAEYDSIEINLNQHDIIFNVVANIVGRINTKLL